MKIAVKNLKNKKVKEIELPEAVFGYPYKEHLVHTAVVAYLASRRRGTHKVKSRSEVRGSGRKPWRQKGTGRARSGTAQSPIWKGGGIVHGPQPRSHDKKLSAREKRNALKSALSRKLREEGILVLDGLEVESHKTGELAVRLERLGVSGRALVVDRHDNEKLMLAARNNPKLKTVDALALNVYDVVDRPHVVISEGALERVVEVLSK
jgi:large subunit ribosomal protein L4